MTRATMAGAAALAALGVALAGCVGGRGNAPDSGSNETVRSAIVTAPADLQLLCASEAATRFGADPSSVLPTSSAQVEPATYQVELTLGGGSATCVIDENGTIVSLAQA